MNCCLFLVFVLSTLAVVIPRQLGAGRKLFNSFNFEECMSHQDLKMMDGIDNHMNYYVNVTSVENRLFRLPNNYSSIIKFDELPDEDHKNSDDGNNNSADDHKDSVLSVFKGIWLINYQDSLVTFTPYAVLFIVVIPLLLLINKIAINKKLSEELKKTKSKVANLENYSRVLQQKCQETEKSLLVSTSQARLFEISLESRVEQLQQVESEKNQTVKILESEIRDGKNEISQLRNDLQHGAEEIDRLCACNVDLWYQLDEEQYINTRMFDDLKFKDEEIYYLRDLLWEQRSQFILQEVVIVPNDTVTPPKTESNSMEEVSTPSAKDMAELPANLRFKTQV